MANTNDLRRKNTKFGGTEGIVTPKGGTADRGGMPELGTMRYNTDLGFMEQYNVTGWAGIDAPPTLTNVTGVVYAATDSTITVSGSNFKSGSVVSITGAGVGGVDRPLATTFVNSGELTAASNASAVNYVAGEVYNIKVTNPSGLSAFLEPAGNIDAPPVFNTAAGTVNTVLDEYDNYTSIATISATDPEGQSITLSETTGNLAAKGFTLNGSTGVISGNPNNNSSGQETISFTVQASDGGSSLNRNFNIIVNPAPDGTSAARAGKSAATIKQLSGTTTNGNYWIQHAGINSGNAFQIYADMNKATGQQWFSPGYYGIEPSTLYRCTNNATYTKVKYRRTNGGSYYWWFLISSIDGSNNCTPIYGALLQTPSGGSAGDDLEANLTSDPITTFGSPTIPSSGNYYISWMSTAPGYTAPSGNIYNDTGGSGGQSGYVQTSTAPTTSTTYTLTSTNTGNRIHINAQAVYNGQFISTGHPSWRGGWTLVLSHAGGDGVDWRDNIIGLRNQTSPTLNGGGYSILNWAPTIRATDTRWEYMHAGNNTASNYASEYGAVIKAGSGDNFLDSTPRNGTYTRQETFPNSTYGSAGGSDSTMYDRPLWVNYGSYSPYPSALLSSFPGTPNWWGTVVEGGYPRGYNTAPYMSSAGLDTPQYQWVWIK
jgi:hypothetical protein